MDSDHKGRLPNALIVGVSRSGTTSLHHYLAGHPEVFMSMPKELRFFSGQVFGYPGKGPGDERELYVEKLDEYQNIFAGSGEATIVGEASPENLYWHREVIPRIRSLLGDVSIIIMLRHPAERAYSAWQMRVREERETLSFEAALEQEGARMQAGWSPGWRYAGFSFYAESVEDYLANFSKVYIGLYDDLTANTAVEFRKVLAFLGVDTNWQPAHFHRLNVSGHAQVPGVNWFFIRRRNPLQMLVRGIGKAVLGEQGWVDFRESLRSRTLKKTTIAPDTRRDLVQHFRPDVERLQAIIGRDLPSWFS